MIFGAISTVYSVENKYLEGCDFIINEIKPKAQKGQTFREIAFDMAMKSTKRRVIKSEEWDGLTIESIHIRIYEKAVREEVNSVTVPVIKGQQALFGVSYIKTI